MKTQIEKLEALTADWKAGESKRKEMILSVLAHIDDLTSDWLCVYAEDAEAYVYLKPGRYYDDSFYNGERQHTDVEEAGVYSVDRCCLHDGYIACNTKYSSKHHYSVPIEMRFTKGVMPLIVKNIERAVQREIASHAAADQAISTLSAIAALLHS